MKKAGMIFALCGMSATAASNFHAPLVGVARDSHAQLRVVYGMAGNFIPREAVTPAAVNWVFTDKGGLVQTDKHLLLLDSGGAVTRTSTAPPGDMLLAPAAHSGALYFLPDVDELWQAGAHQDLKVPLEPDAIGGEVLALGSLNREQAELAVCRGTRLWLIAIDLRTGNLGHQSIASGAIGEMACKSQAASSLLLLDGRLILATPKELIVQGATGLERMLALTGAAGVRPQLRRVGEEWVEVEISVRAPMMVRVTRDGEKVYGLPAAETKQ
jgi:hypothetical protein